jgi:hypothetical protein
MPQGEHILAEAAAEITRLRTDPGRMHARENVPKNRWASSPQL